MDKLDFYLKHIIGKRVNQDIYSESGELLLPLSTIVTYDDVIQLEENNISLRTEDVIDVGEDFKHYSIIIDEAVEQVKSIFGDIRKTKKIPIVDLRENVIPMIHEASNSKHLFQLFAALQAKDDYTYRHNIAVGAITNLIGRWMKIGQRDLLQLTTAALLHDVGKMLIPETILNKPGRLTNEEFATIQEHTIFGYEILKETFGITYRQALVALQHHERLDGSGYPLGLQKEEIDLFSRIVSVADIFHAMSSNRVYQNHFPFYKVLSEMEKEMFNNTLDPEITMLFIEKTMDSLIGNSVLLTDGREGKILSIPKNNPTQPLLQVGNHFIDLRENSSIQIEQIVG